MCGRLLASSLLTFGTACRFYFLGDDDLLEILGQASNPQVIQIHLKKLYAGIHSVVFEGKSAISQIQSVDGERVPLAQSVQAGEVIEAWLSELTVAMRTALQVCTFFTFCRSPNCYLTGCVCSGV